MRTSFFTFLLFLTSSLGANHWNAEDQVALYVRHSELQRRSSWQLLSKIHFRGDENVLDIGCGDGRNSAWISCLVPQGSVIGIDPSPAMIQWAHKQYDHREFPQLSFELGDYFNFQSPRSFDVITSFFSLHIVSDKSNALKRIHALLSENGRFIAVIPPLFENNPEYAHAFAETLKDPKWEHYFTHLKRSFLFAGVEDFRLGLKEAGFEDISVHYVSSIDPFVNQEEFIHWFLGTFPHGNYLPQARRAEFVTDILARYQMYRPEAFTEDGVIRGHWGRVELTARKSRA